MFRILNGHKLGNKFLSLISSFVLTFVLSINSEFAVAEQLYFVRDAETERLLKDYASPILGAAGFRDDSIQPILVNDKSFNAFVLDGKRIFVNLGVIMDAETPNEVIGVLAHETGHIAGNHLVRLRQVASNAQLLAVIGTVLGVTAIAIGGLSNPTDTAKSAAAIIGGSTNIAKRSILAYKRSEETAADRAAVTYLNKTKQSAKGLLEVFQRLKSNSRVSNNYTDPYILSHPLPSERISQLETIASSSKYFDATDSKNLQLRHDLVRAKLYGFTTKPSDITNYYPVKDNSVAANYARAVAKMRSGDIDGAIKAIDALINRQPKNPYFWELKGQALIEAGRAEQSITPFKQAMSLVPEEGLLQIWYGYALVASEDNNNLNEAVRHLTQGLGKESNSSLGYRQLAIAKGRLGLMAEAELATAQGYMITGNYDGAKQFAYKAREKFEKGSRNWILADDIVTYEPKEIINNRNLNLRIIQM